MDVSAVYECWDAGIHDACSGEGDIAEDGSRGNTSQEYCHLSRNSNIRTAEVRQARSIVLGRNSWQKSVF